ncbi:MAG: hypothetical protein Q8P81_01395 [Nanoarchaeota archaeon]|nr:hypothetical protein [Nanoarchaeota archaeon]
MAIIPSGRNVGTSSMGDIYEDSHGSFFVDERTMAEVIEATVTNGIGFFRPGEYGRSRISCYSPKFPSFREDLAEGHPSYSKLCHQVVSIEA